MQIIVNESRATTNPPFCLSEGQGIKPALLKTRCVYYQLVFHCYFSKGFFCFIFEYVFFKSFVFSYRLIDFYLLLFLFLHCKRLSEELGRNIYFFCFFTGCDLPCLISLAFASSFCHAQLVWLRCIAIKQNLFALKANKSWQIISNKNNHTHLQKSWHNPTKTQPYDPSQDGRTVPNFSHSQNILTHILSPTM